ncbi:MAG: redox-sensing transcriptional repressor Rex [Pelosinus sp.]|nr:redox-sensing transcriptional repressor Rex [Pelosinus sp.]
MRDNVVISKATIDRLPIYMRTLRLVQEEGIEIISSEDLGRRLAITPEQIRKDLASFGQFGKKGVGYYVRELIRNIGEILGLNRGWNISIIGVGHLGWALANYPNFMSLGFNLQAIFDIDPHKVGIKVNEVEVFHLERLQEIVTERNIAIGIIAVPEIQAQVVTDKLVEAGIGGIWNFAPRRIYAPAHIKIINEDLSVGLTSLSYYLTRLIKE